MGDGSIRPPRIYEIKDDLFNLAKAKNLKKVEWCSGRDSQELFVKKFHQKLIYAIQNQVNSLSDLDSLYRTA